MVENHEGKGRTANSSLLSTLRRVHETALAKLEQLQILADDLSAGDVGLANNRLREVLAFFEEELPAHFRQEEEILFPALRRFLAGPGPILIEDEEPGLCSSLFCASLCRQIGPEAMYLRDHEALRQSMRNLTHVAQILEVSTSVDFESLQRVTQAIRHIQWLLVSHIAKENDVVFPKAEEVLSPAVLARLSMGR